MDEILADFLAESRENLAQMEVDLVALEAAPRDAELLGRIFRAVHTLKGTCGFFAFALLEKLAHAGEDVLTRMRAGEISAGAAVTSVLLRFLDTVRAILDTIEATGVEGKPEIDALVADLQRCATGEIADESAAPAAPAAPNEEEGPRTVRVAFDALDRLSNRVGELVRARNAVVHVAQRTREPELTRAVLQINRITSELQGDVMRARMEPVRRVFGRLPRIARDVAARCGKEVALDFAGRNTELDRAILEAIAEPLVHLVRNSVDHGIEAPAARRAAGKPAAGSVRVGAWQASGHVVIEVHDDGAGIDPEALRARAVERGIVGATEAARLDDREATELIFRPGFSTALTVTSVSGRGVGMDVVKSAAEAVGGRVQIESERGRGTRVRVHLPLTLAIINGVIVEVAGQPYVIYEGRLREFLRLEPETTPLDMRGGVAVHRLRGRPLPLVHLDRLLDAGAPARPAHHVAVVESDGVRFGLVVDRILDNGEVAVKRLGPPLDRVRLFNGAAVLGDDSIALVLDVPSITEAAGVEGMLDETVTWEEDEVAAPRVPGELFLLLQGRDDGRVVVPLAQIDRLKEFPRSALLRDGDRRAVLDDDRRLPLVHIASVLHERREQRRRPDVRNTLEEKGKMQVAVCRRGERAVGLIVERILDIVELNAVFQAPGTRVGVLGTIDVDGRIAECVDVSYLAKQADPLFFHSS